MQYFNEASDAPTPKKRTNKKTEPKTDETKVRTPADDFHDQVEKFYSIPREQYPRKEIKFSPSGVTKCARELYFQNINAAADEALNLTPWKQRVPRNGEGVQEVTQRDYLKMHKILKDAGMECEFMMARTEVTGRKEFDIDGVKVVLSGRCDGILLDRSGTKYIWEKKTKDKMKNMKKLKEPQEDHKWQVVCYSLIFGIPRTIFEIESLQKPDWGKDEDEDMRHFYFESNEAMEQALLKRLAQIVKAVQDNIPPPPEFDKCMFCSFKETCRMHLLEGRR